MKNALFFGAALCLIGIFDLPIGYYTFLRIYIATVAAIIVFEEYASVEDFTATVILFSIIAILFNPFIPIYLHEKEIWIVIDIIVGILFLKKGLEYKKED